MATAPIDKIRKLIGLSLDQSNPHEAANARVRADELLAKHGLDEADLIEEATEVADLPRGLEGSQRGEVARQVAKSRGVRVDEVGDTISFTGYPEAALDARQLFVALVALIERHCELPETAYSTGDRFAWRTCYWLGFAASIQLQLDPEHGYMPKEAMSAIINRAQPPAFLSQAAQALLHGRSPEEADRMRQLAHDEGQRLATHLTVPPYRGLRK